MSKRSPRLLFTQEERTAPELKKAVKKADKAYQKLEKAETKIPKKTVKRKQRTVDPQTGRVTTRLSFEEVDKKRPPSKLTHALRDAPGAAALSAVHREIREHEQDNVGVESAHGVEQAAGRAVRLAQHAHRSHKEKPYRRADRAEAKADRANLRALDKTAQHHDPQFSSNPYSRWQQKQAIKREYAAAKAGKSAGNTVKASEATAKAARKAAENTKKAGEFIARHKKGFLIVGGIAAMIVLILCTVSSCSLLIQGGATGINVSTYPSEDADMLAAEAQYCAMEAELQQYLDTYESTHDYDEYHFDLDTPFEQYPEKIRRMLLHGTDGKKVDVHYEGQRGKGVYPVAFEGLIRNVERKYRETGSDIMKQEYESFMRITPCKLCGGMRLKKESLAVTVCGKNIYEITSLSIDKLQEFLSGMTLNRNQELIGKQILKEIRARVGFLVNVGLGYLSLSRATGTLSGGEAQRIRLATQIGSGLVGVCYILDEPSIGLHQRDNDKLLAALKNLRDLGNTLIVVEHDEDTMLAADYVVDIGPGAGSHGGEVVACGTAKEIMQVPESITGQYLSGKKQIPVPKVRRKPTGKLTVVGAQENNLKNINVDFPLGVMTAVTGVSGSGKSSLVNEILYKHLAKSLNRARTIPGKHKGIKGIEQLDKVINIDQSPIGRTPRSNPATYTGVFDQIRDLFASTADAKAKGYKKGRFSFNVKGGRCEACGGDGIIKIEMHFLPDVYVPCEVCGGKRYNRETLDVKYKGKSIYDVLDMTVEEALPFFENVPSIRRKIETLNDVGLSYVKLGQPSTELSGGEAQRIKLATELSRRSTGKTIYILDEPTTGLHFADVQKLVEILQKLTEGGNTVVVIEHNLDVIKTADYIIDIGPEGGDGGGTVIAKGTPEEVAANPASYTGKYIKKML